MSTSVNNLFVWNRELPAPYDTLTNKKVNVQSQYGDKTTSTLCSSVMKAVLAVCKCKAGDGQGAVGIIDHRAVVEYKSSVPDVCHLVVYDPNNGNTLASVMDVNTRVCETYTVHKSKRDGSAVIMAMFPALLEDTEFNEHFEKVYSAYKSNDLAADDTVKSMAILCDNAYRRIKDDQCPAHLKSDIDSSGNLVRISQSHLDSGHFNPTIVYAGEFEVFTQTNAAPVLNTSAALIDKDDFIGKYAFNQQRTLNSYEQSLVPVIESWYILPPEIVSCCKHALNSTGKTAPMRNFMLRGPAGTGKTAGARAFAAGVGLPYMKYTCSANTEIFDCATRSPMKSWGTTTTVGELLF